MFLDELRPLAQQLLANPIAFAGGFAAGLLRLNLNDEPVKSWLQKNANGYQPPTTPPDPQAPQSIDID